MEVRSHVIARFFKILLPSTITQHKLRIPTKFVDQYGDELSKVVKLIDLVDATWYVKLEKAENTLWFNDGWKKFVDDHSIGYFFFLLFEYIGNSSFNVHIFDSSATEVDYPTNDHNIKVDEHTEMEQNSDDDSIQIVESFAVQPKNHSFRIRLKPYNRFQLYVPRAFSKYFPGDGKHFELHDSDGKKWVMHVSGQEDNRKFLGKGWTTFVREKGLKVGDTCVFKFIDVNKCTLKVISRNTKSNPKSSSSVQQA